MFILAIILQAATVFPTVAAPPQHNPMVIATTFQSEVDPLESFVYVYGNIQSNGELKRTEILAPYELKFLKDGHGDTALEVVAAQHGMGAGKKSWVVVKNNKIMQWERK